MTATLLLADDSVTIQRVIELTFADEDVDVVAFSDGDSAIAWLEHEPPDIVLADVGMPGKSGYEVARHIRQTPRLAHIPVLLLTGAFEPIDRQKANEAGCDGVLVKPFEPQLVISRVNELLARTRGGVAVAAAPVEGPAPDRPGTAPLPAPPSAAAPPETPKPAARSAPSASAVPAVTTRTAVPSEESAGAPAEAPPVRPAVAASAGPVVSSPGPSGGRDELHTVSVPAANPAAAAESTRPGADVPHGPLTPPPTPSEPPAVQPRQGPPPLAEAFAVLLAAEQRGGLAADLSAWAPPAPVVSEDLVERVAQRVLGRLTDQVVRDTIGDLVSTTAERMIREEIERIKASIK